MSSGIVSVSQSELTQRRRKLRQQRRVRTVQNGWRVLAVCALAGGSVWLATLPDWVIRQADQVSIEGNQFIPAHIIRGLLPIQYPQSILRVQPEQIARELKTKAPISDVVVGRKLFPPGLIIQVKERHPVAIAIMTPAVGQTLAPPTNKPASPDKPPQTANGQVGLLDENGMWIPLENYAALQRTLKLPTLKVIGNRDLYQSYWAKLYQAVRRSPVKITEINLQNPANLILTTELGIIHFGSYSPQFPSQLAALDRMRTISTQLSADQIAYIDLRNPASPTVQLK
jgi:cell division protein FtsQ